MKHCTTSSWLYLLPDDVVNNGTEGDDEVANTTICLPIFEENPKQHLDEYLLSKYSQLVSRSKRELLLSSSFLGDNTNNKMKVLNVLQGEIAHATSLQVDTVLSTDATTCHIVAFRSSSSTNTTMSPHHVSRSSSTTSSTTTTTIAPSPPPPLVTVAHIDKVGYKKCFYDTIQLHLDHHHNHQPTTNQPKPQIHMEIHIVGGFLDEKGSSQALSTFLITQIVELANHFQHQKIQFTLSTICVSTMNTTFTTAIDSKNFHLSSSTSHHHPIKKLVATPIARGLAIATATGKVYMVNSCPKHLLGPAIALRTARLWSSSSSFYWKDTLYRIHDKCTIITTTPSSSIICTHPFRYNSYNKWLNALLQMTDEEILLQTSTSPHCEGDNYCETVRDAIRFMQKVYYSDVFGPNLERPLYFVRNDIDMNKWDLIGTFGQEIVKYFLL